MKYFGKKSSNYPYAATRVRAKRRFLIKNDEYLRLSVMDLTGICRYIGDSQYKNEIESLSSKFSDAALIERATNENMARTYNQIIGFCTGELREMITSYISKVDAWNVKTLLRGRFHGSEVGKITSELIPAGKIKFETLEGLARLDSIDGIIEGLKGTIFYKPLNERLKKVGPDIKTLMPFENDIDKVYYSHLLATIAVIRKSSTRQFLMYIRKEIDVENLTTLFKIKFELLHHDKGIDNVEDYMIPGGHELKEAQLKKLMATTSFTQFINELRHYSFYDDIKESVETTEDKNSLTDVTRECEKHLLKQANRFAALYPLSILPIINYLILKKKEVDNLRIIASGRSSGLQTDTIRGLLVM